jgi:hypothetical protein
MIEKEGRTPKGERSVPDEPIEQQPPDVLAMILADTVLHETPTGKFFIEGTYSAIFVHDFPHVQPMIVVFLCITNGRGRTPIRIRLIDVDETTDPIFEADATLEFEDP